MKKLMVAVLGCAMASGAMAESAGFQLSLTPDIAIQDRNTEITGLSIGIWNENPSPKFNWQIGFANGTTGDSVGVQFPAIYNYAESYTGLQLGIVNYSTEQFVGLQWGVVNVANELTGAQLGTVNVAQSVDSGFQMGVVNYAATADNLFQLGVINIIADNAWFSDFPDDLAQGMVIVNWSFGAKKK